MKYLKAMYIAFSSLSVLNAAQNLIISMGTLGGCILVVYDVHAGRLTVGTFLKLRGRRGGGEGGAELSD